MKRVFPVLCGQYRLSKKINLYPHLRDVEVLWHIQECCSNGFLMALATEGNVCFQIHAYFVILLGLYIFLPELCALKVIRSTGKQNALQLLT